MEVESLGAFWKKKSKKWSFGFYTILIVLMYIFFLSFETNVKFLLINLLLVINTDPFHRVVYDHLSLSGPQ